MKSDLRSMEYFEVEELLKELGAKQYRVKQIYNAIAQGVTNIDELYSIPKDLREKLKEVAYISETSIYRRLI